MNDLGSWIMSKADTFSAAATGGVVAVAFGWRNPLVAMRQIVSGLACGWFVGPAWYGMVEETTPFHGEALFTSFVFIAGVCGLWIIEGSILLASRWSKNPKTPWRDK